MDLGVCGDSEQQDDCRGLNDKNVLTLPGRQKVAELDLCTICLEPITERAVAAPCNHLTFDYLCLVQWVQTSARCPLCAASIREIQFDWRTPTDFKRYIVPSALQQTSRNYRGHGRHTSEQPQSDCQPALHASLRKRRYVYEHKLYSLHMGSNSSSDYDVFSAQVFSLSEEMQSRARTFLRRDLAVLDSMLQADQRSDGRSLRPRTQQVTASYLVEYIVAVLRTNDAQAHDGRAQELLGAFMPADIACLLLHELVAWLRSPFVRLQDWDEAVQYTIPIP